MIELCQLASLVPRLPSFFGGYAKKAGKPGDKANILVRALKSYMVYSYVFHLKGRTK